MHVTSPIAHSAAATTSTRGIVEVFAGIGSVARGFCAGGGYQTLLLNDIDPHARGAYVAYAGEHAPYFDRDIRHLRRQTLSQHLGDQQVVGLLGCPPCQGFSDAGQRQTADPRNRLVTSYFRLIGQLKPRFFVMENVERLLEYKLFRKHIEDAGKTYCIWSGVLNAALYGVPQTRTRAIVIGYHKDLGITPTMPLPTHLGQRAVFDYGAQTYVDPCTKEGLLALGLLGDVRVNWSDALPAYLLQNGPKLNNLITLEQAIGDLPEACSLEKKQRYAKAGSTYATGMRGASERIHDHQAWNHRPSTIERLQAIPEGGVLLGDGKRGRSRQYFSQAYARLHRDGLARTITTNFHNAGSGRFLHYERVRTLTIREAARIQGIPDTFLFDMPRTVAERLIGNAFPEPMAGTIAAHVRAQLGH